MKKCDRKWVRGDLNYEYYAFFFSANSTTVVCEGKPLDWANAVNAYAIIGEISAS